MRISKCKMSFDPENIEINNLISSGSYGTVYKITEKTTSLTFAMKVLELNEYINEKLIENEISLLQEIENLKKKPKIFPKFHGYFKQNNRDNKPLSYSLIFDLQEGNLNNYIKENNDIEFSILHSFFRSLLNGLSFLQSIGICHRDLKPSNILFTKENNKINFTLIDFGISKKVNFNEYLQEMTYIGTENYFSPELRKSNFEKIEINPYKSDVFSLGLLILKLSINELPIIMNNNEDNYFKEIKKCRKNFKKKYKENLKNEEINNFNNIYKCLKNMLIINFFKRPDFIELFRMNLRFYNMKFIREIILLNDNFNSDEEIEIDEEKTLKKIKNFNNNIEEIKEIEIIPEKIIDFEFEITEFLNKYSENNKQIAKISRRNIILIITGNFLARIKLLNSVISYFTSEKLQNFFQNETPDLQNPLTFIKYSDKNEFFYQKDNTSGLKFNDLSQLQSFLLKKQLSQSNLTKNIEKNNIEKIKIPFLQKNIKIFSFVSLNLEYINLIEKKTKFNPIFFYITKDYTKNLIDKNLKNWLVNISQKNFCELKIFFGNEKDFLEKFISNDKETLGYRKSQKCREFQEILKQNEEELILIKNYCKINCFCCDFNEINDKNITLCDINRNWTYIQILYNFYHQKKNEKIGKKSIINENLDIFNDFLHFYEQKICNFFELFNGTDPQYLKSKDINLYKQFENIIEKGVLSIKTEGTFLKKKTFITNVLFYIEKLIKKCLLAEISQILLDFIKKIMSFFLEKLTKEEIEIYLGVFIDRNIELFSFLTLKRNEINGKIDFINILDEDIDFFKIQENDCKTGGYLAWSYETAKTDIFRTVLTKLNEKKVIYITEFLNFAKKKLLFFQNSLNLNISIDKNFQLDYFNLLSKITLKIEKQVQTPENSIYSQLNIPELNDFDLKEVLLMYLSNK